MTIVSHYLDLYGWKQAGYGQYWADTKYTNVLDRELPDEEVSATTSTACGSEIKFIFLDNIKTTYFIDGVITGHFKMCNSSLTTEHNISSSTVILYKVDSIGTETKIGGWRRDPNISITTDYGEYITVPFKFIINEVEILPNEKLILSIDSGTSAPLTSDLFVLHSIFTDYGPDLNIKIPLTVSI